MPELIIEFYSEEIPAEAKKEEKVPTAKELVDTKKEIKPP